MTLRQKRAMKNQISISTLVIIMLVESISAVSFGNNGRFSEQAVILPVHELLADNTDNNSGSEGDSEEVPPKIIDLPKVFDLKPEVT